jgi:hypothetical protein
MDPRVLPGYEDTARCLHGGNRGERPEINGQPDWRCSHGQQSWPVTDAHG